MALCECGHSEERHDPEENICQVGDCECEEFLESPSEDYANDADFYTEGFFSDGELIPEDDDSSRIEAINRIARQSEELGDYDKYISPEDEGEETA